MCLFLQYVYIILANYFHLPMTVASYFHFPLVFVSYFHFLRVILYYLCNLFPSSSDICKLFPLSYGICTLFIPTFSTCWYLLTAFLAGESPRLPHGSRSCDALFLMSSVVWGLCARGLSLCRSHLPSLISWTPPLTTTLTTRTSRSQFVRC